MSLISYLTTTTNKYYLETTTNEYQPSMPKMCGKFTWIDN